MLIQIEWKNSTVVFCNLFLIFRSVQDWWLCWSLTFVFEWSLTLIELRCVCHWRRNHCQSVKLNTQSKHISSIQISFRNLTPSRIRGIIHSKMKFLSLRTPSRVVWTHLLIYWLWKTKEKIWEYLHSAFSIHWPWKPPKSD